MKIKYAKGATPLDPDEMTELIPAHIMNQNELNEFEEYNILQAVDWVNQEKFSIEKILDQNFIKKLHQKMFDQTWRWAGRYRLTEKNIGVSPNKITVELKKLLDDVRYQIKHNIFDKNEIVVRFHHRLVSIHPFANGNGRHARLIADTLLITLGENKFSWGEKQLSKRNNVRDQYIQALKSADKQDYKKLLSFVNS